MPYLGPSGAEWGRVGLGGVDDLGPSGGAEWGWAIQLNSVRAEWGRVVGEGLGMHWDSIKLL